MGKELDSDKKRIEDLLRERDILNKNVIKADERTKRQETQALNLQKDIARWKQDASEFKKRIFELEKQREKYGIELSQANSKYFNALKEQEELKKVITQLKEDMAVGKDAIARQDRLWEERV